jgi:catechol 2,3-dioxygenase-like lactoylglutathione lyase family enzyme
MIIDHIGLVVGDYRRSKYFYTRALAPLGIGLQMEAGGWAGFGKNGKPEFWFGEGESGTLRPVHIAFVAESRVLVGAFYVAALAAGGRDNGPPGIREIYHSNYYGAFVLDPDGHNIEAVCHRSE